MSRLVSCLIGLAIFLLSGRPSAQTSPVITELERYARGEHDAVVAQLAARKDFDDLLNDLRRDGPAWIEAGGAADLPRRTLAAATFALEAARAAEDTDWKWVQRLKLDMGEYRAPDALYWKAPPLLVEWGCALVRNDAVSRPIERIWQLAAVAVAQRRGDYEFLIGSPWEERGNPQDEIEHLSHAIKRFPDEPRFALAQAIAVEWRTWSRPLKRRGSAPRNFSEAVRAFDGMTRDEAIGAEASLRLGVLRLRARNLDGALALFDRVEDLTRDRYLTYLARYFKGQALDRKNRPGDAERAYRGALAAIPHAGSATIALSALLFKMDRRLEASGLVEASLSARPQPIDPWRAYGAADDRFWPELIGRLRGEIRR